MTYEEFDFEGKRRRMMKNLAFFQDFGAQQIKALSEKAKGYENSRRIASQMPSVESSKRQMDPALDPVR